MNLKRTILFSLGGLFFMGLAMATTYFCLEHFVYSRKFSKTCSLSRDQKWTHLLGLTPEQEKQLAPFDAALEKDLQEIQLKMAQERMALCTILRDNVGDSKDLEVLVNRIAALESQQQTEVVRHLVNVRNVLTPEQKTKFFSAIMQDICQGCRAISGDGKEICGMCKSSKGSVQ